VGELLPHAPTVIMEEDLAAANHALAELVRSDPPLSLGAVAVYPYSKAKEKSYRFRSKFDDEVLLHRVSPDGKFIWLPRALCPVGPDDARVNGLAVDYPKSPVPRDYQVELFAKTAKFLKAGESGVVCAATGWGKTALGFHAAHVTGVKTLVITTKEDIYEQWLAGAQTFLGLAPSEIGEIRGDKCEVVGTKFCVALIQSLSKADKYPDWIDEEFGLVIFDEVHRVPADKFSEVVYRFRAKLRLGLSATPDRWDGKELVWQAHIGPLRASSKVELLVPKVLLIRSNWSCPRRYVKSGDGTPDVLMRMHHEAGKTATIEKIIGADSERNHMIGGMIRDAFEKGRKTVVFSTQHEHLKALQRVCSTAYKIQGRMMGMYVGATTVAEKATREREKTRPILFTTYSMMSEGTSLDWLDTCILAMPRSHVTQPVGRIRREYPNKHPPVVMDVIDDDSPVFEAYSKSRAKWYASIGCIVKEAEQKENP